MDECAVYPMFRRLIPSRLLLVGLALLAITAGASAQTARIGGFVRDEKGKPLRRAVILAVPVAAQAAPLTAATDDDGRFALAGLSPGTWRFDAEVPGYEAQSFELDVRVVGPRNPPVTFTLRHRATSLPTSIGDASTAEIRERLEAADALYQQGQWSQAIDAYRSVLELAPSLTSTHLRIAAAYRQQGDYGAAIDEYQDLLAVDPAHQAAHVGLAKARVQSGNSTGAEQGLRALADSGGAGPDVLFTLAEIARARGAAGEAATWYAMAVEADPAWPEPRYRLSELALESGDVERATALLQEIIAVAPQSPEADEARGTLKRLGR